MIENDDFSPLGVDGLRRFQALQADAVNAVTERFYTTHASVYEKFGARGREACREDLAFHLEFLRPVLEFGLLQPMLDYLFWLASVLDARAIPTRHLALSLDWLGEFFAENMEPAEGGQVAVALLRVRTEFVAAGVAPPQAPQAPPAWPAAVAFEAALLAGKQQAALAVVNRCLDSGSPLVDVELHVIQPALYRIGEKWQANQVSVAQEHLATAIVQAVMTLALLRSPPSPPIDKRVLLACVEGNKHALGLRMVADAFQLGGWEVQYLGADVPVPRLLVQAAEWQPDLLGLSVSFPQQLRVVRTVIAELEWRFGSARPAVIVGGLAINRFDSLAAMLGADQCSTDARAAVVAANRMLAVAGKP